LPLRSAPTVAAATSLLVCGELVKACGLAVVFQRAAVAVLSSLHGFVAEQIARSSD
jgi:hypothetical protein